MNVGSSIDNLPGPQSGRKKIAQRFIAGVLAHGQLSPDRDERDRLGIPRRSFAPPGLVLVLILLPRLKPLSLPTFFVFLLECF